MTEYKGPLRHGKMPPIVAKAYTAWQRQRQRCNDPNDIGYRYYGEKGIRLRYGSRDFVNWYLRQRQLKEWDNPTVGRIDHDKDYTFDNIEMQEMGDNIREMSFRNDFPGARARSKACVISDDTGPLMRFRSIRMACRVAGIDHQMPIICRRRGDKTYNKNGMTLTFLE